MLRSALSTIAGYATASARLPDGILAAQAKIVTTVYRDQPDSVSYRHLQQCSMLLDAGQKIVFIGDSITEADRQARRHNGEMAIQAGDIESRSRC